jgi:hypothetical protein
MLRTDDRFASFLAALLYLGWVYRGCFFLSRMVGEGALSPPPPLFASPKKSLRVGVRVGTRQPRKRHAIVELIAHAEDEETPRGGSLCTREAVCTKRRDEYGDEI